MWSPTAKSDEATTVFVATLWGALSSRTSGLRCCNGKHVTMDSVRGSRAARDDTRSAKSRVMMRGEVTSDRDTGAPRHKMMRGSSHRKRSARLNGARTGGNHHRKRPSAPRVMMRGRGTAQRSQSALFESEEDSDGVKSKYVPLTDRWRSSHLGRALSFRSPSPSSVASLRGDWDKESVGPRVDADTAAAPAGDRVPSPLWVTAIPMVAGRAAVMSVENDTLDLKKRVVPAARRRRFFGSTATSLSSLPSSLVSSSAALSSETASPVPAPAHVRRVLPVLPRSPAWTPRERFPAESIDEIMAQLPADHFLKTPKSPNARRYASLTRKDNIEAANLRNKCSPSDAGSQTTGSGEETSGADAVSAIVPAAVSPKPPAATATNLSQPARDNSITGNTLENMLGVLKHSFLTKGSAVAAARNRTEAERGVSGEGAIPPPVWVTGYVDRSSKYGLGFRLCDGNIGARFDDGAAIVLDPAGVAFDYIKCATRRGGDVTGGTRDDGCRALVLRQEGAPCGGQRVVHSLDHFPDDLEKKVNLLKYFRENLQQLGGENDVAASTALPPAFGQVQSRAPLVFVERWRRTRNTCLFLLSNGTVHVRTVSEGDGY